MQSSMLDDPDFAPAGASREKAIHPIIRDELADGERLVWVGQPRRPSGRRPLPAYYRFVFLVLGFTLGAIGFTAVLLGLFDQLFVQSGAILIGVASSLMGLGLMGLGLRDLIGLSPSADGSRPSVDPLRNWFDRRYDRRIENTCYALTDRRIILCEPAGFGNLKVRSLRPGDFTGISRTQRPDGSGGISLEIMAVQPTGISGPVPLGSLCGIDDVRAVEALIRATLFED